MRGSVRTGAPVLGEPDVSRQTPLAIARRVAPSAVVSWTAATSTGTPRMSDWNCMRNGLAVPPPSTLRTSIVWPPGAWRPPGRATDRRWTRASPARCARLLPRVNPMSRPRAYMSQCGAPSPTKAGTRYTSPLSGTDSARNAVSAASEISPRPSRSHCTAAPVTNALPSSAYVVRPRVAIPRSSAVLLGKPADSRRLARRKQPVPYVFLASPVRKHAWPNNADCWSPAAPAIGTLEPRKPVSP